jgi:putative ABC transport system permease protein
MMFNNIKITFRRLGRQKLNTTLHIAGLTIGMSVCLLIGLFLRHELSFDSYHAKAGRTYRICTVSTDRGNKHYDFSTPMPTAEALRAEVPGLETVASWQPVQEPVIVEVNPHKRFLQEHIVLAEPELLDVFDFEVLEGDAYGALGKPYQALLTETTAGKFFGNEDPIGKTFKYRDEFDITVAGIIKDLPANTHIPASMLISFYRDEKFINKEINSWTFLSGTSTYVVLPENTGPKTLPDSYRDKLKALSDKYLNNDPNIPKHIRSDFGWQPLSQVHFEGKYAGGSPWVQAVSITWLWFFGIIGLAVLALACINFVNLSTAQALTRAKEVGVRKSVGAGRGQLVQQFLGEAWLLAGISGILAVAIAQFTLPFLNQLIDKQISFDPLQSPALVGALLLGILLTGLLAGLYPAWVIARFDPASSLKTTWNSPARKSGAGGGLRKGLVVTQFSVSVALLIAVTLIAQQVNLLRSKSLGFDKENIVEVSLGKQQGEGARAVLAAELGKIAAVKDYSFASASPSSKNHMITIMSTTGSDDPNRKAGTWILADDHFGPMYGLQLLAGRFPESADTSAAAAALPAGQQIQKVVVNETCVEALGFGSPDAALGKRFWMGHAGRAQIAGVVADFNTLSLHEAIIPTFISQGQKMYETAGIKIEAGSDLPATIAAIGAAWEKAYPQGIFSYKFLDEQIDDFYKAETRLYSLFKIFAGLAMLISCLGLWGLATFAAQQRTKEIGIRKILGASTAGIVGLLSKDFLKLVILSLVIASPLAYFFMEKWLADFAFRINISWRVFALAGAVAVGVAFLTVSFQSAKAALANPVKSLRSE